jgi:ABC-type polar amino acid transport system ATPase subunit
MLVVTHEMAFAHDVGTRLPFMDAARVVEDKPPAAFFDQPETGRARAFPRRVNARDT